MAVRQIVLDTETTGMRTEDGHRIIEIGCVEMVDRKLTGKNFHYYINPEREVEAGALAVHGISNEFLQDKPLFKEVAKQFIEFVAGSELIIHNAPFDVGFLDYELSLTGRGFKLINEYCKITDTLPMARQMHVGQRNSLDALCKRYGVDNTKRDLHGALLDAHLLAQVYLAMTGGQGSFFEALSEHQQDQTGADADNVVALEKHAVTVINANPDELAAHEEYLAKLKSNGACVWQDEVNSAKKD